MNHSSFVNYAHRGASEYLPENTLLAFYTGIYMGANGKKTDVQKTKDGILVLFHDDTLMRVTGQSGSIADYTFAQLQAFDVQKNKILNAFGCESLDYFDAAKWRNEEDLSIDSMTVFKSFADSSNKGPSFVNHRYLNEDVPMGLGLFISIGKIVGIDTSIQEGIMALASALLNKDLKKEARTIQYLLQKEDVSLDDIKLNIL